MNIAVNLQVQQMRRVQLCCRSLYGPKLRFHVSHVDATQGIHSQICSFDSCVVIHCQRFSASCVGVISGMSQI